MLHPLSVALGTVISASTLAIGVALAPDGGDAHHSQGSHAQPAKPPLRADGLQLLGQVAEGHVAPDPALELAWVDDVTAVAHSLGLSDSALAHEFAAGRSLSQIAASRGVSPSTPTSVLLSHVRDDLRQAEHDGTVSPSASKALTDAISTALG